jgi:hypothetical protein
MAKGFCHKHYQRLLAGGDPHVPSRKELSVEERLQAGLGPKDPVTGCIEWTGAKHDAGYGLISRDGKLVRAHRLAWELKHGPIPEGLEACHHCDNRPCCNPDHLFLDTQAGNMADMRNKGRDNPPKGVAHIKSKLTEADVLEIRRRLVDGESHRRIASDFGICNTTVGCISRGKTWLHLK